MELNDLHKESIIEMFNEMGLPMDDKLILHNLINRMFTIKATFTGDQIILFPIQIIDVKVFITDSTITIYVKFEDVKLIDDTREYYCNSVVISKENNKLYNAVINRVPIEDVFDRRP